MRYRSIWVAMAGAMLLFGCNGADDTATTNTMEASDVGLSDVTSAGPRTGMIFCDVVKQRVAKEDCEDLEATRDQVRQGSAAFNVPDPMRRDETVAINLVVDRRTPAETASIEDEDLQADNSSAPGDVVENASDAIDVDSSGGDGSGAAAHRGEPRNLGLTPKQMVDPLQGGTETFVPKVGRFMSAELAGQGFEIKAVTPRSQELPDAGQAIWTWEVKAKQKGSRTLTLKTVVEGEVNGRRYMLDDTQTLKTVTVEVGMVDTIGDWLDALPSWLKRITAILIALAALVAAWFGLKAAIRKGRSPAK
jgi:hypothetical protein